MKKALAVLLAMTAFLPGTAFARKGMGGQTWHDKPVASAAPAVPPSATPAKKTFSMPPHAFHRGLSPDARPASAETRTAKAAAPEAAPRSEPERRANPIVFIDAEPR